MQVAKKDKRNNKMEQKEQTRADMRMRVTHFAAWKKELMKAPSPTATELTMKRLLQWIKMQNGDGPFIP
jgi:hypothetical protein